MWLVALILDSPDTAQFHHPRKFSGTVLPQMLYILARLCHLLQRCHHWRWSWIHLLMLDCHLLCHLEMRRSTVQSYKYGVFGKKISLVSLLSVCKASLTLHRCPPLGEEIARPHSPVFLLAPGRLLRLPVPLKQKFLFIIKALATLWTLQVFWTPQVALVVKNLPANAGDVSSIPGSGRSPGGGHINLLRYSCLENPMDRGAWWAPIQGVAKSQTRLKQLSIHVGPLRANVFPAPATPLKDHAEQSERRSY